MALPAADLAPPAVGRTGRLVFGQMYEDPAVEAAVLPRGRVLCVASGGSTAFALAARGWQVTAVDVNRAQVDYLRRRLAGAPYAPGSADRLLALARALARLSGWRRADLEHFCGMHEPAEQLAFWRQRLDTRGFRVVLSAMLSRAPAGAAGIEPFTSAVPVGFDRAIRRRLERGWARFPNATNPFARLLLLGPERPRRPSRGVGHQPVVDLTAVNVVCADVIDQLESGPPARYDGFSLSNVLDATGPPRGERLMSAVRRAAAPGAVLVLRSFADSTVPAEREWAARDRSMLWGGIRVEPVRSR